MLRARVRGRPGRVRADPVERERRRFVPIRSPEIPMTDTTNSTDDSSARAVALVPEARRMDFLPLLFGRQHVLVAEMTIYHLMERLSPLDYCGGLWDFYERDGRPLYLAPTLKHRFQIVCNTNGYEGEVSADAAGIIATLFAFSYLSFKYPVDAMSEGYGRLYDYAADHPESAEIFQAID
jgi:hypothetical protein